MSIPVSRLAFNDEIVQWAVRCAVRATERRQWEEASRWAAVAARTAAEFGVSQLAVVELEALLASVAASLAAPRTRREGAGRCWLHVMSDAHAVGGHTALVQRWIKLDQSGDRHDLVLTIGQSLDVPELKAAVEATGGSVMALGGTESLTDRARNLRSLADRSADIVVLHIHPFDVVPSIAFGIDGGPPVLLLNHADHVFWVGTYAVDAVIALRPSGEEFGRLYRGLTTQLYLPVPIDAPMAAATRPALRASQRSELAIPENAPVLLTIGSEFKYQPVNDTSFFEAARRILMSEAGTYLLAVGPRPQAKEWAALRTEFGSRAIAVGHRSDLRPYHAAGDVYAEGFPFGSLTALLEAGLEFLPPVRAPEQCPPPFTSDGIVFASLPQPKNLDAYVSECLELLTDEPTRKIRAAAFRQQVLDAHSPSAWQQANQRLRNQIPDSHRVRVLLQPTPPPAPLMEGWATFLGTKNGTEPVWFARGLAEHLGLTPVADSRVSDVLAHRADFASLYRHGGIAKLYPWPTAFLGKGRPWLVSARTSPVN